MFGVLPSAQDVTPLEPQLPGVPTTSASISSLSPCSSKLPYDERLQGSQMVATAATAEQWLMSADPAEVRRVLATLRNRRPELFHGLAERDSPEASRALHDTPRAALAKEDEESTQLRRLDAEAVAKELPLVQFSAPVYFCRDSEGAIVLEVVRLGAQDGCAEVHYSTECVTAFAGFRYERAAGKLVFEPGETQKEVRVQVYETRDWEPTTEFLVKLLDSPKPSGCVPGRYLHKARVKVIDEGCFPALRFRQLVEDGMACKIPKWSLLYEYVRLNFRNPVVRRGTIKMVMLDALHTAYFLLNLLMNVYLVDDVIKGHSFEEPLVPLLVIAGLLVVPFGVLHVLDWLRLTWKVGGGSRTMLQKALLRKFLNYNENSRQQLNRGDFVMAMTRDVVCLVHDGYANAIALIKSVSQIMAILLFQILAPLLFDKNFNSFPFVMFCVFPIFLLGFLLMRREVTTRMFAAKNRKQDALVAQVDRTVTNYRAIADFNRRPFSVSRFEAVIKEYNSAEVGANKVLKNNTYFAPWVTSICVAFYTVHGGLQASANPPGIGIGMFLANIAIIRAIGSSMGSIYSILLEMQGTFPALENITTLLNLPIDLPQRMEINRFRRHATSAMRALVDKDAGLGLPIDRLTITAKNVNFDFGPTSAAKGLRSARLSCSGSMEVLQGRLVSLVGPKGEGKTTLLKMFGGVIMPRPEAIFIPSHLRVLHISPEPLFFWGSLFENVTFGVSCDDDGQPARVAQICSRLGLPKDLLSLLELGKDGAPQAWNEVLSFTQRCLLCLARAFVANPELMCIHKPTMPFDEQDSTVIFKMLREFCKKKGVELSEETRHLRRPRTCIMTSSKKMGVEMSDDVYVLNQKNGIRKVDRNKLEEQMLH